MAAPQLPGGAAAPRTDTRGATRCWDEEPGLGDEAQDVRNAARTLRRKPGPAAVPAAGSPIPCIYSFNNNKSHLFIPFREGPCSGHLSGVFCCFRFPSTCVPHPPSLGRVRRVPTWAQLSLCGSFDP